MMPTQLSTMAYDRLDLQTGGNAAADLVGEREHGRCVHGGLHLFQDGAWRRLA